jgi:methionyl-tRNA formyltransferase
MAALRIIFMGTPEIACESLQALIRSGCFQIPAVVCQPDQPKGRGLQVQAPPVKDLALREKITVLQPESVRDENFVQELGRLRPDLIVVTAYGQILPKAILDLPPHGCLNLHTSLLPRYRGAAPIQWALLNGDAETGVTLMKMDAGMDTGGILVQEKTAIRPADTAQTVHDRLGRMGAELLVKTIPEYVAGHVQPRPQPAAEASYAPKIRKQDGQIDWKQSAEAIWNRVRAMVPWPGAFTFLPAGPRPQLLKIWAAEVAVQPGEPGQVLCADKSGILVGCGSGALRLCSVQREGARRMSAGEFLTGHPLARGQMLI